MTDGGAAAADGDSVRAGRDWECFNGAQNMEGFECCQEANSSTGGSVQLYL